MTESTMDVVPERISEEEEKQTLDNIMETGSSSTCTAASSPPKKKKSSLHDSTACETMADSYHMGLESEAEQRQSQEQGDNQRSKNGCLIRTGALMTFVLVVVAASVLLEPVIWQGSAVSPRYYEQIIARFDDSLSEETRERIDSDPDSPQAKAYEWTLDDPGFFEYPNWRQRQRFALATIYFALNGPSWRFEDESNDWLSHDKSECQWQQYGDDNSPCRKDTDVLERLILYNIKQFQGNLPPEVRLLFGLEEISILEITTTSLSVNLTSFLPWEDLANMEGLKRLDLSSTDMHGSLIPGPSIGLLSSLEELNLSDGSLSGTIPEELSLLTNAKIIDLRNNQLQGNVPDAFCSMPNLVELRLDNNPLEGEIPTCFQSLPDLIVSHDGTELLMP